MDLGWSGEASERRLHKSWGSGKLQPNTKSQAKHTMSCDCASQKTPVRSMSDMTSRIEQSKHMRPHLDVVERDSSGWRTLLQCPECRSFWIEEFPWSEQHGGGPAVLLPVAAEDTSGLFRSTVDLVPTLRRQDEERQFMGKLGPELGPEFCQELGCRRLRIQFGAFCWDHHFKMLKGHLPSAG
jgi:hypothetical protein